VALTMDVAEMLKRLLPQNCWHTRLSSSTLSKVACTRTTTKENKS
jgi:hypothetical protein